MNFINQQRTPGSVATAEAPDIAMVAKLAEPVAVTTAAGCGAAVVVNAYAATDVAAKGCVSGERDSNDTLTVNTRESCWEPPLPDGSAVLGEAGRVTGGAGDAGVEVAQKAALDAEAEKAAVTVEAAEAAEAAEVLKSITPLEVANKKVKAAGAAVAAVDTAGAPETAGAEAAGLVEVAEPLKIAESADGPVVAGGTEDAVYFKSSGTITRAQLQALGELSSPRPLVLTVAGLDSGGGAGITADVLTIHDLGAWALPCVSALTVQSLKRVRSASPVGPALFKETLETAVSDWRQISAVKVGLITGQAVLEVLLDFLETSLRGVPVVWDPVLCATAGRLESADLKGSLARILKLTSIFTPNLPEALELAGWDEERLQREGCEALARVFIAMGARAVILKGGHRRVTAGKSVPELSAGNCAGAGTGDLSKTGGRGRGGWSRPVAASAAATCVNAIAKSCGTPAGALATEHENILAETSANTLAASSAKIVTATFPKTVEEVSAPACGMAARGAALEKPDEKSVEKTTEKTAAKNTVPAAETYAENFAATRPNFGEQTVKDFFVSENLSFVMLTPRVPGDGTHGGGCALSSALSALLSQGYAPEDAAVLARGYVYRGILEPALPDNGERPPLGHHGMPAKTSYLPEILEPGFPTASGPFPACPLNLGFYPVVDTPEKVEALCWAGVRTVQLRCKDASDPALWQKITKAVASAEKYRARLFVDDHYELAAKAGAYGVHLGMEDLRVADLQAIKKAGLRLGVSTHGVYELQKALQLKPSYIALGHIFPTNSKKMPSKPQGLTKLRLQCSLIASFMPVVAIGGIKLHNLERVLQCGVPSVALISAISRAPDPLAAAQEWLRRLGSGGDEPC